MSTSDKAQCSDFNITANIILLANEIPDTEHNKAVLKRCYVTNLKFTNKQIISIIEEIATPEQKPIVDWLKEHHKPYHDIDLRTFTKLANISQIQDKEWQTFAETELKPRDKLIASCLEAMKEDTAAEQATRFEELTGLKKSRFYETKKRL